jgi:hypothetical protein
MKIVHVHAISQRPWRLLAPVCGLLCLCCCGLWGCGGGGGASSVATGTGGTSTGTGGTSGTGSGSTSAGPDRTADFVLKLDAAGTGVIFKPGQTLPITLDLFSVNGFPSAITLSVNQLAPGWTVVPATPTISSLPKGITKVIVNVTAPANASPGTAVLAAKITATGGGLTRNLNGSNVYDASVGNGLVVGVSGMNLQTFPLGSSPFVSPFAFVSNDLTGNVALLAIGSSGPVTVSVTSSTPGLTASLVQSSFTPGSNGAVDELVPIKLHIDSSLGGGAYPLTLTATASDGTKATSTFSLYVKSFSFVASPSLNISGRVGSTASVEADVIITGAPTSVVQFTIPDGPDSFKLTVSPTSVTIPASGSITQHVALQGQTLVQTSPTAFTVSLTGTFGDMSSQSPSFFVHVN